MAQKYIIANNCSIHGISVLLCEGSIFPLDIVEENDICVIMFEVTITILLAMGKPPVRFINCKTSLDNTLQELI